jgi:hypothetical protein
MPILGVIRKALFAVALTTALTVSASQANAPDRHRVGAVCNDGSDSKATGSGACSHHQGVKCWKYSDGSCTKP